MILSLACVNGVVPPELTFARLVREVVERPVRLHDLVGYSEVLPRPATPPHRTRRSPGARAVHVDEAPALSILHR